MCAALHSLLALQRTSLRPPSPHLPAAPQVRPLGKYQQLTLTGHLVASPALSLPLLPRTLPLMADLRLLVEGSLEEGQVGQGACLLLWVWAAG